MAKNGKKTIPEFQCDCMFDPCCKDIEPDNYNYIGNTSLRENVHLFMQFDSLAWFQPYQVNYKARRVGDWEIYKYTVTDRDALVFNLNEVDAGRHIAPGNYTSLVWHGSTEVDDKGIPVFPAGQTIMSDSPAEISDHMEFIDRAYGRILINGLGLGVVANALLQDEKRDCIEHIDVVELNPEVIELVSYYFKDDPKITIHQGDAYTFEWPHDAYWHCAWHDIWYTINPDDLPLQDKLHNKYKNRVQWQDSWHRRWLLGFQAWLDAKEKEVANG
jgi:hypothetical protein